MHMKRCTRSFKWHEDMATSKRNYK